MELYKGGLIGFSFICLVLRAPKFGHACLLELVPVEQAARAGTNDLEAIRVLCATKLGNVSGAGAALGAQGMSRA